MHHFKCLITIFALFLLFTSDSMVTARRHVRRQAPCSPSLAPTSSTTTTPPPSQPTTTTTPISPPPTSTPVPSQPPSSPGPPNPPVCNTQPAGICQLVTKCTPSQLPQVQDAWVFNSQCNVIGGTTGIPLYQSFGLTSQLPYVIVMTGNSPTASPSFDYAGGHYGVNGGGNPGWWCAIESDGTFDCYATFNC